MVLLFSKLLSGTDIRYRLAIPTETLPAFQIPKGQHSVGVAVFDVNDRQWFFTCSTRTQGHSKPVFCGDWTKFVRAKGLTIGDLVIVEKEGRRFTIRALRKSLTLGNETHWPHLKLPGKDLWADVEILQ